MLHEFHRIICLFYSIDSIRRYQFNNASWCHPAGNLRVLTAVSAYTVPKWSDMWYLVQTSGTEYFSFLYYCCCIWQTLAVFTSWYDVSHAMGFRVWGRNSIKNHSLTLRTVPTIVSAHTFCASRKTWFKRALALTLTQSTTLQIKAKFSYGDQIKFNEPILEPGTPK